MWQANWVASKLQAAGRKCELVPMDTKGDRMLNTAIPEIGSKGVFTAELEQELWDGSIDLAVHSAKDMPSELPDGFEIIAFTVRENAHDVLVSDKHSIDLSSSITIGTSSSRRLALLKHYYPEVNTVPVRGNIQTRIKKLKSEKVDALVLAFAGLHRMGLDEMIRYNFPLETFVPAVGQGSMAVEAAEKLDAKTRQLIRDAVNHDETELCLKAERAFLYTIQGGCSIPAFALAQLNDDEIRMRAGIISLDGSKMVNFESAGKPGTAYDLGASLARKILDSGGQQILNEISIQQNKNDED